MSCWKTENLLAKSQLTGNMSEFSLPKSFLKRMEKKLGEEYPQFLESLDQEASVSVRKNPIKKSNLFNHEEAVPWNSDAYYLKERPEFVFDPMIHAGSYYVQEASSMLFANGIDFSTDLRILDLCASPGGKSTLLLSKMSDNSILFSNELVNKRADILKENLVKWGYTNVVATSNRAEDFSPLNAYFDVVLVDAPCSGEGMFRKNNKALSEWAENKAFVCSIGQKDILDEAIKLVKHNGLLIYSTCTYSEEENEQIVEWFHKKYQGMVLPASLNLKSEWGVRKEFVSVRKNIEQEINKCYPHKIRGEGMFIAAFRIQNNLHFEHKRLKKFQSVLSRLSKDELYEVGNFIDSTKHEIELRKYQDSIYALPKPYLNEVEMSFIKFNTILAGSLVGKINKKNKELIPVHNLAMSGLMRADFPFMELDKREALHYLKKQDLNKMPENIPGGWFLAKHQGTNLGFMKNVKNRLNNFYPREWVIRKNLPNWDVA
jgi:16S rRNA C967 or C1407 C5-methylase (RsmB/RsmF family)/NOL1/NOP2/fmu family ribosome biogenesis protein